jgi:hypothetical protein
MSGYIHQVPLCQMKYKIGTLFQQNAKDQGFSFLWCRLHISNVEIEEQRQLSFH